MTQSWERLINVIENAIVLAENPGLLDSMREYNLIYIDDKKALQDRRESLKSFRSTDVKGIDKALSQLPTEEKLLTKEEIAIEMSRSIARMMLDLPKIYSDIQENLKIDGSVLWMDERSSESEYNEQISLLEQLPVERWKRCTSVTPSPTALTRYLRDPDRHENVSRSFVNCSKFPFERQRT